MFDVSFDCAIWLTAVDAAWYSDEFDEGLVVLRVSSARSLDTP
jgi:hypothetical protein